MSLKYKIAAAIVSLPLFFTVFFAPCLLIRASASGVSDDWISRLASVQYSNWSELPEDFKNLGEAYVNTFKSIGSKDFFSTAADVPLSWYHILDDTTPVLSVGGAVFYYLDKSGNLKFTKKGSSGSGNSIEDNATLVDSRDKLAVDGKTFRKHIEDNKDSYAPTGRVSRVSWKTDKNFSNSSFDSKRTRDYFTILEKYNFFGIDGLKELYAVPFFEYGDDLYFSNYCIYFNLGIQQINSSGEISLHTFDIGYVDTLNTAADLTNPEAYKALFDETKYSLAEESYIVNRINSNLYSAWYYYGFGTSITLQKREDFFSTPGLTNAGGGCAFFKGFTPFKTLYNSKNSTLSVSYTVFNSPNFSIGSLSEKTEDYGFYISNTPILMEGFGADIDTTKIPDNYFITVGGDTIYDYNITNPVTGDTTTINNYITNNYTFITNQGDGTGGGTVNNYYDGAIINNGDNHYYDGATINNGDNITNNYNFSEGDTNFFTQIGVEIQNALNFAFVPSDGYMDKFNADLRNTLESKIPFVYDIGDIFNSLFVDIVDNNLVYSSDINSDGSVDESSVIYPKWTFNINFFGTDYELVYLDFSMYSSTFFYIRIVVACFTYLAFFVMLLKSLPSIIGNVGSLVSTSYSVAPYVIERFSDVPKGGD